MINILIIEDESHAIERLQSLLDQSNFDIEVIGICESVKSGIHWCNNNKEPDVVFSDIQLGDGLSFEIFQSVNLQCPIIFVTAYDSYAIRAFDVFSIDYILKPYELKKINEALSKYSTLKGTSGLESELLERIGKSINGTFKTRFFSQRGDKGYTISIKDIACFVHEDGAVLLINNEGKKFVIDYSLDTLETIINPIDFFRINRQMIVQHEYISEIKFHHKGKIELELTEYKSESLILVSRRRAALFKQWLNQ